MHPSRHSLIATCAVATLLLVATPAVARGQALASVAPDARVRVDLVTTGRSWRGRERVQSVIGTLSAVRADTVLLVVRAGADPVRVPLASLRGVYASRGRPPRWQAAIEGAIAPALIGAAFSAASANIHRRAGDPRPAAMAASSAAWGAASGAVLGAWSPKERWHRLTLPAAAEPPAITTSDARRAAADST